MQRAVILFGAVSFVMALLGTIVGMTLAVPAIVEAQQAKLSGSAVSVIGDNGADRVLLSSGPGAKSQVAALDPSGRNRINLTVGGENGNAPANEGVNLDDINGAELARIGTGGDLTPGRAIMRLSDQAENPRVIESVASDGTPSIALRDDMGTDRVSLSTGPGVRSGVRVLDSNGTARMSLVTGGRDGATPASEVINFNDANGKTVALLGTEADSYPGARGVLHLDDQAGHARILISVANDGTPSIQFFDVDGNMTWSAQ